MIIKVKDYKAISKTYREIGEHVMGFLKFDTDQTFIAKAKVWRLTGDIFPVMSNPDRHSHCFQVLSTLVESLKCDYNRYNLGTAIRSLKYIDNPF